MKLKDAYNVIESIHGFSDETSSAGESWSVVQEEIIRLQAENDRLMIKKEVLEEEIVWLRHIVKSLLDDMKAARELRIAKEVDCLRAENERLRKEVELEKPLSPKLTEDVQT